MEIGFASLVGVEPIPFAELVRLAGAHGLSAIEVNTGPGYAPIGDAQYGGHLDLDAIIRDGPSQTQELLAEHGVFDRYADVRPFAPS